MTVPENHPLRSLFNALTRRTFMQRLKWSDPVVSGYVSNLLIDFTHVDQLYRIHNRQGLRQEEVAGMLLEADVLLEAGSFEREREVHKHIGDFTLFMAGVFPEFLQRLKVRQLIHHQDFLVDYIKVGKHSYGNVAEFDYGEHKDSVLLYRKLSENFELCVVGLGYIREYLERLPSKAYLTAKRILSH